MGRGWAGGRKSKKYKKYKNPNLQTHTKLNYFTKLHTKLNYLTEFSLQTWLPSCRAGAGWLELGAGLGRGLKIQKIKKIQKSKSSNTSEIVLFDQITSEIVLFDRIQSSNMAAELQSRGWLAGAWGGAGQAAENPKNPKNPKIQIFKHIGS